ncbi:hypothetical protein LP419_17925 [Massilia sp. H-1]|nr:hypothetical protein LP419_17925 [Massilia sp. H-1]
MIGQFKDQLALYWLARTEQERKYLTVGGATPWLRWDTCCSSARPWTARPN